MAITGEPFTATEIRPTARARFCHRLCGRLLSKGTSRQPRSATPPVEDVQRELSHIEPLDSRDRRVLRYEDRARGVRRIELTHDLLCSVVKAERARREKAEAVAASEALALRLQTRLRAAVA